MPLRRHLSSPPGMQPLVRMPAISIICSAPGSRLLLLVAVLQLLASGAAASDTATSHSSLATLNADDEHASVEHDPHPVYLSEYKLRSEIQLVNVELRQLKRDFEKHIREVYFQMKLESKAKGAQHSVSLAVRLIGAEFADILIKEHIIKRRALSGLKMLYAKLLPIWILNRLVARFPDNYSWLKHLNQLDIRPTFADVGENYLIKLYSIIGQRVRVRAADDLLTMTTDNMKRILKIGQWFLVEQREPAASSEEKNMLAHFSKIIIDYYVNRILKELNAVQEAYNRNVRTAFHLKEAVGGDVNFFKFIDQLINTETLEIQLNKEATGLDIPLTINADMIDHLEARWIPEKVLDNVNDDRRVLMANGKLVKDWIVVESEQEDADLASWCAFVERQICSSAPY